jgi:glycosyltransferase involved in cell wall biosynthesis
MKLLATQVANGFSPEARVFAQLLKNRGEGYEPIVFHHSYPEDRHSVRQFGEESGAPVREFDFGWRFNWHGQASLSRKVLAQIRRRAILPRVIAAARRERPDLVYSCQQKWDLSAATSIARILRAPQIIHLHYNIGPWLGAEALSRLNRCAHVVCVSDFIRDQALRHGVSPERATTIHNALEPIDRIESAGLSVRDELGIDGQSQLIGIVARVDEGKGHDDTIQAFSGLYQDGGAPHLLIVGDGASMDRVRSLVQASPAADRIHVLGRRNDIPRLLSALDLFCHPSRMEPFGLAVLEAAAIGLPVVAFREGGITEIVRDGATGYLTPVGNIQALRDAMQALLSDPDRAKQMGAESKRRVGTEFRPADAAALFVRVVNAVGARKTFAVAESRSAAAH